MGLMYSQSQGSTGSRRYECNQESEAKPILEGIHKYMDFARLLLRYEDHLMSEIKCINYMLSMPTVATKNKIFPAMLYTVIVLIIEPVKNNYFSRNNVRKTLKRSLHVTSPRCAGVLIKLQSNMHNYYYWVHGYTVANRK